MDRDCSKYDISTTSIIMYYATFDTIGLILIVGTKRDGYTDAYQKNALHIGLVKS